SVWGARAKIMSNPAFAQTETGFANAERCSVWTKPNAAGPAPFVAWGQALREAFETPQDEFEMPEEIVPEPQIDIEAIRAEAMAQGFAAGIEAGRREANDERVAL